MEGARSLGFAARFVTGYVYVSDRDGPERLGGGSTHAWCSIYIPGSGWVEFDPTNGIVGNRDLIRVGVARTPQQAIPLWGTYWGEPDDEVGMEVAVNVKSETGVANHGAEDTYTDPPQRLEERWLLVDHLRSCAASDGGPLIAAERTRFAQAEFFAF